MKLDNNLKHEKAQISPKRWLAATLAISLAAPTIAFIIAFENFGLSRIMPAIVLDGISKRAAQTFFPANAYSFYVFSIASLMLMAASSIIFTIKYWSVIAPVLRNIDNKGSSSEKYIRILIATVFVVVSVWGIYVAPIDLRIFYNSISKIPAVFLVVQNILLFTFYFSLEILILSMIMLRTDQGEKNA